jgi:undecaprenyl-diphosphatase
MTFSTRLRKILIVPVLSLPILVGGSCTPRAEADPSQMGIGQAVVLGVVEGFTEYLPVSSTGHLILAQRAMGIGTTEETKVAADAYAICIQAGAILAVLGLYWEDIRRMIRGLVGRDREGFLLLVNLGVAFVPAAVVGLLGGGAIKELLFGLKWVVAAWFVGGVAILAVSRYHRGSPPEQSIDLYEISWKCALVIGLVQCIAVWPGTSRSLVTIVAGILAGLSLRSAVVFSFLLGAVTLSASTIYDATAHGTVILESYGWHSILTGFIVAFISAVVAVRWMVEYLKRHGLTIFGYYRIVLAIVVAILMAMGILNGHQSPG